MKNIDKLKPKIPESVFVLLYCITILVIGSAVLPLWDATTTIASDEQTSRSIFGYETEQFKEIMLILIAITYGLMILIIYSIIENFMKLIRHEELK